MCFVQVSFRIKNYLASQIPWPVPPFWRLRCQRRYEVVFVYSAQKRDRVFRGNVGTTTANTEVFVHVNRSRYRFVCSEILFHTDGS